MRTQRGLILKRLDALASRERPAAVDYRARLAARLEHLHAGMNAAEPAPARSSEAARVASLPPEEWGAVLRRWLDRPHTKG